MRRKNQKHGGFGHDKTFPARCGGRTGRGGGAGVAAGEGGGQPGHLVGQGFYQQEDQALKNLIAAFEKESGIKADLQLIPGPDLITTFIAGQQVGDVPDVVQTNTGWTFLQPQAAWKDQLVEVSDVIAPRKSDFLPAALEACYYYNKSTGITQCRSRAPR